jgi:hypothetical protein
MCRRYLLHGAAVTAFGVGVLMGVWLESGLLSFLLAWGAICFGVLILTGKCGHK